MNKLLALAEKFETKLGMTKSAKTKLPKSLRRLAKAELQLQKRASAHQSAMAAVLGPVLLKTASGTIPGQYVVCTCCQGRGKVAVVTPETIKVASQNIQAGSVKKCPECKGERVIKCANEMCSPDDVKCREDYLSEKKEGKSEKKKAKLKEKAAKAVSKAAKAKAEAENPTEYSAKKMQKKLNKKAERKAKKAMKRVKKLQAVEAE